MTGPFGDGSMADDCPNCGVPLGDHTLGVFMKCGDELNTEREI